MVYIQIIIMNLIAEIDKSDLFGCQKSDEDYKMIKFNSEKSEFNDV